MRCEVHGVTGDDVNASLCFLSFFPFLLLHAASFVFLGFGDLDVSRLGNAVEVAELLLASRVLIFCVWQLLASRCINSRWHGGCRPD